MLKHEGTGWNGAGTGGNVSASLRQVLLAGRNRDRCARQGTKVVGGAVDHRHNHRFRRLDDRVCERRYGHGCRWLTGEEIHRRRQRLVVSSITGQAAERDRHRERRRQITGARQHERPVSPPSEAVLSGAATLTSGVAPSLIVTVAAIGEPSSYGAGTGQRQDHRLRTFGGRIDQRRHNNVNRRLAGQERSGCRQQRVVRAVGRRAGQHERHGQRRTRVVWWCPRASSGSFRCSPPVSGALASSAITDTSADVSRLLRHRPDSAA